MSGKLACTSLLTTAKISEQETDYTLTTGVSALRYSQNGALLASGGQDTEVVIWDVTSGAPLYRLQGHLGQVTALVGFSLALSSSLRTAKNQ